MEFSQINKHRIVMEFSDSTSEYILKGIETGTQQYI